MNIIAFDVFWTSPNGPSTCRVLANPESQGEVGNGWTEAHALEAQQTLEYLVGWPTWIAYVLRPTWKSEE